MGGRGANSANGRGGGGGGGGAAAAAASSSIPASARPIVQNLKEIVNCPDSEIYAMLKECNMDPNEAISRLLTEDPFHEVKSKREKKKENKDTTDTRPRGNSSTSGRGNRGGMDRGRGASNQFSSYDSGAPHSKTAYKKDNGQNSYSNSFTASAVSGNNLNRQLPVLSDPAPTESKISATGSVDGISSSSQASGVQSAWLGVPGQTTMADIVKRGGQHGRTSGSQNRSQQNLTDHHVWAPLPTKSHHDSSSPQDHVSKVAGQNSEHGAAVGVNVSPHDDWPLDEQPAAANMSAVLEPDVDPESSKYATDGANQHMTTCIDEVPVAGDGAREDYNLNYGASASVSGMNRHVEGSGGAPLYENDLHENQISHQPQADTFETHEEDAGAAMSSAAESFQRLNLREDHHAEPEEDNHSVKIPDHLQVRTEQFSHLSFGSFGPGINASMPGQVASQPSKDEEPSSAVDASLVVLSDTRNYEYYGDEHLRTASDGSAAHRSGANVGSYDNPSVSQPEALRQENSDAVQANQYTYPSSASGYNVESAQHLNPAFTHSQSSSQMPNHTSFSNVYTNSLPSSLLASTVQPVRESDHAYSPFPMTQSMPPKFSNTMSSISGPTISMPEALRTGNFTSPQPTAQSLPGASAGTGPALPQHLAVHPYSQPTLPLGHFTNMIGYPFLPQSYTYLPSAFQQAFTGSSYHQSLAAVLPQYKNSVSVSSLPQSAAIASGYGAFGSSSNIPGSFSVNPPAAPTVTTIGYDDIISSHYKDGNPLVSVQQNDNSAMWLHGLSSRTMSAVPPSTYYNYQGQNQQVAGFRQGQQQPTQHIGALGYPNFYHSQAGMSLEQQNPRDGNLGGSQSQQAKQSQQIWQNSY